MTTQKFIVLYNETFLFLRDQYGEDAVRDLWAHISEAWCNHLSELTETMGLSGLETYWGGPKGTLEREKAAFSTKLTDETFVLVMDDCPSVAELRQHGVEPMHGELSYCDHCEALYAPVVAKHGLRMTYHVERLQGGNCSGKCKFLVEKAYK